MTNMVGAPKKKKKLIKNLKKFLKRLNRTRIITIINICNISLIHSMLLIGVLEDIFNDRAYHRRFFFVKLRPPPFLDALDRKLSKGSRP